MNAKDLLNWGELSRFLAGSRQTVRKNSIPKIHQPFVNDLIKAMNKVISKRLENPSAEDKKFLKYKPNEREPVCRKKRMQENGMRLGE